MIAALAKGITGDSMKSRIPRKSLIVITGQTGSGSQWSGYQLNPSKHVRHLCLSISVEPYPEIISEAQLREAVTGMVRDTEKLGEETES